MSADWKDSKHPVPLDWHIIGILIGFHCEIQINQTLNKYSIIHKGKWHKRKYNVLETMSPLGHVFSKGCIFKTVKLRPMFTIKVE